MHSNIADELALSILRQVNAIIGTDIDLPTRVRLKGQSAFLIDHCRRSVNSMINAAGSSSFRSDAPLQRFFRDINTLAPHAFLNWEVAREQAGRRALDLEPNNPML